MHSLPQVYYHGNHLSADSLEMAAVRTDAIRDRTINVHFSCQRCCQPLKLDPTFDSLDEQMFTDLTGTPYGSSRNSGSLQILNNDYQDNGDEGCDISRKMITPVRLTEGGNGFMLVGDTNSGGVEGFGHQMWVTSRWCDILSDQSDIDHPLCEECTDALLDRMDQELRIAEDECRDYREFLEKLQAEEKDEDLDQLKTELEQLKLQEVELRGQLKAAEEEEKEVEGKLEKLLVEREKLQTEEECFFAEYTSLKRQVLLCEDEQRSVDNQLRYAQGQLDRLNKTNVFNATFHIWHSGQFGTINNFKLGRLPNKPVDWSEINAAWGQTALLLYSLAKEMNLVFKRYRLVPYGNHSFLESLENRSKELPLYFSGGLKFFWDAKFDQAMVAFLDCLQQFQEEVEKGDPDFSLPYRIDNGKIEDKATKVQYSIKIQFNSEEQWTKALKFMLTNLKWGLTWVSAQFAKK